MYQVDATVRHSMIAKRTLSALLIASILACVAADAHAQTYPSRPIKMIVPFTPGSPVDVMGRLVADHLSARLGQPVVIDNRPGAGTTLGTKAAAAAEPDGYTLLFNSSSIVVAPAMYKNLDYDPLKSFAAVANVAFSDWVMVVPPSVPARSVQEFVAYAKANPGKLNFGFGQGTAPQLVGEWLKVKTGIDLASVPYKGGALAVTDMLGDRIHLNIGTTATLLPLVQERKVRAIAVWGEKRYPELPDVPTMIESGFPGISLGFWVGLVAPAGTPAPIIDKLNGEINAALGLPAMKASMAKLGLEGRPGTPQQFGAFLADELPKWAEIVRLAGVKTD
jgi:tripartite-type tricarboxylate transporter receptor subunit TctC